MLVDKTGLGDQGHPLACVLFLAFMLVGEALLPHILLGLAFDEKENVAAHAEVLLFGGHRRDPQSQRAIAADVA